MKHEITKGSGNVFADIGLPRPEEHLEKAKLGCELIRIIKKRKLTQARAAKILGVDQAKISALMNGRFYGFSVSRLIKFLNAFGKHVRFLIEDIQDKASPRKGFSPGVAGLKIAACGR